VRPIVLDTGVLIKVFVGERESPKATALLRAAAEGIYRLAAPDFMAVEFGYDIAIYDGAFLAAAADQDVELVTADETLHRKVGPRLPWVRHLRDFQP
jgi:predicted nucleic acid-binding protein